MHLEWEENADSIPVVTSCDWIVSFWMHKDYKDYWTPVCVSGDDHAMLAYWMNLSILLTASTVHWKSWSLQYMNKCILHLA